MMTLCTGIEYLILPREKGKIILRWFAASHCSKITCCIWNIQRKPFHLIDCIYRLIFNCLYSFTLPLKSLFVKIFKYKIMYEITRCFIFYRFIIITVILKFFDETYFGVCISLKLFQKHSKSIWFWKTEFFFLQKMCGIIN